MKDSVLFFNNVVGEGTQLDKIISDVNNTFGSQVRVGESGDPAAKETTVIGWNNNIPAATVIGSGCTLNPSLPQGEIPQKIRSGEVVR